MKTDINIINHSGFWGDSPFALRSIMESGCEIDYLVSDYLSEVTLGLLEKMKKVRPGYLIEFVDHIGPYLEAIQKRKIKVITNAGANDPQGLVTVLEKIIAEKNLSLSVCAITGDRINDNTHAYLGAFPIVKALELDADIIITGRVVDSAVTLAPMIYEFKWDHLKYDLLAQGSLAGHLIECGAQVCGGNYSDYQGLDLWNTSFPHLNITNDGVISLKLIDKMTGLLNRFTTAEQLVYEIGDPGNYLLPDVICDFREVKIEEVDNRVKVTGAKGSAPLNTYKTLTSEHDGYRLSAPFVLVGPEAVHKAKVITENIIKRIEFFCQKKITDYHLEILGSESTYGQGPKAHLSREVVAVLNIRHPQKELLNTIAAEIAPAALSMTPGMISLLGGRAKPTPLIKMISGQHEQDKLSVQIHIKDQTVSFNNPHDQFTDIVNESEKVENHQIVNQDFRCIKLHKLAYARSGDKGNHANIGIIAKDDKAYGLLKKRLTKDLIRKYFNHAGDLAIFDIPGISSLNIVLYDFLDGGGLMSLRIDSQGKGLGQQILDLEIPLGEDDEV